MVQYRQLGKSGLRVSMPILGAMSFGSSRWSPWVLDEESALPILNAAWDNGVNTIDTANVYSNGYSESIIGKFISKYNVPRNNLVIMTKAWGLVSPDPETRISPFQLPSLKNAKQYVNQGGLSRSALLSQVDASLARLNTSYIDLLQIHAFDPTTPIEETMKALHDLISIGKVRYIGACTMRTWQFAEMNHVAERNGWTPFISMQIEHSLLYRTEELELFGYCEHKGIGIVSFSPLMDGHLARPDGTETARSKKNAGSPLEKKRRNSDKQIIKRVEEIANRNSWTMAQVALAWSARKVSSFIVGVNSVERLEQAIVDGKVLSEEDENYLEERYEFQKYRW